MRLPHATVPEIIRALTPHFPGLSTLHQRVESAALMAVGILGVPREVELSGDYHRAWRTFGTFWCDESNGLFELKQERDGLGLDCIVCDLMKGERQPFLLRTGHLNQGQIRRNNSNRQSSARACGRLSTDLMWPEMDEPGPDELVQMSLAHSRQDKGTKGGMPAWWTDKIVLGIERFDGFDELAVVDQYSRPASIVEDVRRAVATARPDELAAWRRQFREARRHG